MTRFPVTLAAVAAYTLATSIPSISSAQGTAPGQPEEILPNEQYVDPQYDFSELDAILQAGIEDNIVPGVSLLLLHEGRPVYAAAYGERNLLRNEPFTLDTVARIYSSSKWISGAAVMRATDEGLFALDDTAGDYLPDYADMGVRGSSETTSPRIRQMFSHSSGMDGDSPPVLDGSITMEECVDQIIDYVDPLLAAPGNQILYGSNSMQVSGRIIEITSGEGFESFLESRLLDPLGMVDSSYNPDGDELSRMGPTYIKFLGSWIPIVPPPSQTVTNPGLAYGMYSTLEDYGRFLLMIRNRGRFAGQQILSPRAVQTMSTDQAPGAPFVGSVDPPPGTRYGIGNWLSFLNGNDVARFTSSAGFAGTFPWYDQQNDLAGVFFIQVILTPGTEEFAADVVTAATRAVAGRGAQVPDLPLEDTDPSR